MLRVRSTRSAGLWILGYKTTFELQKAYPPKRPTGVLSAAKGDRSGSEGGEQPSSIDRCSFTDKKQLKRGCAGLLASGFLETSQKDGEAGTIIADYHQGRPQAACQAKLCPSKAER